MSIFNPVQSFVDWTGSWQTSMKNASNKKNTDKILTDSQTFYQNSLNSTSTKAKNSNMSASNLNTLAGAILTYAEANGKYDDYAYLQPSEMVTKFLEKNKGRGYENYINMYTGGKMGFDELTRKIGINQDYYTNGTGGVSNPLEVDEEDYSDFDPSLLTNFDYSEIEDFNTNGTSNKDNSIWWKTAIGGGIGAAGLDLGLNYGGKGLQKVGRQLFNVSFTPSLKEESLVSTQGGKIYEAKRAKSAAEKALEEAKSTGVGIEEAENNLRIATNKLEGLEGKGITKTSQSAWENGIGTDWRMGWLPGGQQGRAAEAKGRAREIFTTKINKFLEESTDTVNVVEVINNLQNEINKIAGVHPGKQKAYGDALEVLKEMFSDEKFYNLPVREVQKLKEDIWNTTPQKFFNGKELSNEYNELNAILGEKLKDALHKSLTKTAGEDTAKLYLDYANLMNYASTQDKLATKGINRSKAKDLLVDPASQKGGRLIYNTGKLLEENTKGKGVKKIIQSVSEGIGNAWNYISQNGKKFFKSTKGGLTVEDPVGIIELLQLVPGTIGDLADLAAENPGVVADQILFEVQDFKDTWNKMTDDERIQQIKTEYNQATGDELDDASAKATYENWKKKHKNGKYGLFDSVNDIEIVKSV